MDQVLEGITGKHCAFIIDDILLQHGEFQGAHGHARENLSEVQEIRPVTQGEEGTVHGEAGQLLRPRVREGEARTAAAEGARYLVVADAEKCVGH